MPKIKDTDAERMDPGHDVSADLKTLEAEILGYLKGGYNGAAFPELLEVVERSGETTRGGVALYLADDLVAWSGVSEQFARAMSDLIERGRVHFHALTSELEAFIVHSAHGEALSLPMVTDRRPSTGYKSPHWVPVVVYSGSGCGAANCLGKDVRSRKPKR